MFWIMTALWMVLLLAPLALLVALLPAGRDCPRCGGETLLMRSRFLKPMVRFFGQRWCLACGWEGMMRYGRQPAPVVAPEAAPEEEYGVQDDDAAWKSERDNSNPF